MDQMTVTVVALAALAVIGAVGMFVVFGGGFRTGDPGRAEGRWARGGGRIAGNMSPPLAFVMVLSALAVLLMLLGLLAA
jgi:hypothetical protein